MNNNSNLLRAIIGIILAAILIIGSLLYANKLADSKAKPKKSNTQTVNKVYTQLVTNEEIPVSLHEKGKLQALKKVELYSEVQGILQTGNRLFKPGQTYSAGSTIMSIDDGEFNASLIAQKAVLYNLIAHNKTEVRVEYLDVFEKWENYLNGFDIQRSTPALPEFDSDKEKFFINGKNIITTYYNIKNLEEKHKKYTIYAPFYSVVTESLVNPGTLVRAGQQLGTIISPSSYEIPISINESYKNYLKIGKDVILKNLDNSQTWNGRISRIDPTINTATQGILAYITVTGKGLKEGMFLEAEVKVSPIEKGYEIPRRLLVENTKIYVVKDNKLHLRDLDIAIFKQQSAIVTNLPDGTILLENAMPGAYEGMLVEPIN